MDILSNALEHFDRQRAKRLSINVDQWGDGKNPAVVYFYAVPTMYERARIHEATRDDPVRGMMVLLCYRALDADGKHIFDIKEIDRWMRSLDPDVIADVAARIETEAGKYRIDYESIRRE